MRCLVTCFSLTALVMGRSKEAWLLRSLRWKRVAARDGIPCRVDERRFIQVRPEEFSETKAMNLSRALHRDHERILKRNNNENKHFHFAREATLALKRDGLISELEASITLTIHRKACRAKHGSTAAKGGDFSQTTSKTATSSGVNSTLNLKDVFLGRLR